MAEPRAIQKCAVRLVSPIMGRVGQEEPPVVEGAAVVANADVMLSSMNATDALKWVIKVSFA